MPRPQAPSRDRGDTPAAAYRVLPAPSTAATVASLLALATVAWVLTVRQAGSMADMVNGLGQVGRRMPNDMGIASFLGMWSVMMAAMMSPSVAPAVLAHRLVLRRRDEGVGPTVAFVAGYLAVWSIVGVLYLVPFLWFRALPGHAGGSRWLAALAGAVLAVAGGYQFTRRKTHCQQSCCSPVAVVGEHDVGSGVVGGLRTGASYGIHCLGCCWALMAVLLVVGLMNVVWMVALSVLFLAEKHSHRALVLGRLVGVALVVLGLAVVAKPSLLHAVSGASEKVPTTMHMNMG